MEFLNKLYANENFGIGLFCVIAFLVVMFFVVLFFGKKDEKKRKLEETNKLNTINNEENSFKETTVATPVEVPAAEPIKVDDITSVVENAPQIEPVMPVEPISYEPTAIEKEDIANPTTEDTNFAENMNVVDPVAETSIETPVVEPIIESVEPIPIDVVEEPAIESPVIEPIRIQIPDEVVSNETVNVAPIIEEVKPLIEEMEEPIIEEPTINNETYYNPVEPVEATTVDIPNIDFDAIAKSISKELDELENESRTSEVEVTPIKEITEPMNEVNSVYTNDPVKVTVAPKTKIELPKKIELPAAKTEEIEPESYQI